MKQTFYKSVIAVLLILSIGFSISSPITVEAESKTSKTQKQKVTIPEQDSVVTIPESDYAIIDGKYSLYAMVDSEKKAKSMAKKLGIEFDSYSYGVATFLTPNKPEKIVKKAKKLKLPTVSINREMYAH